MPPLEDSGRLYPEFFPENLDSAEIKRSLWALLDETTRYEIIPSALKATAAYKDSPDLVHVVFTLFSAARFDCRAVMALCNREMSFCAVPLVRTVFETYCSAGYLVKHPEALEKFFDYSRAVNQVSLKKARQYPDQPWARGMLSDDKLVEKHDKAWVEYCDKYGLDNRDKKKKALKSWSHGVDMRIMAEITFENDRDPGFAKHPALFYDLFYKWACQYSHRTVFSLESMMSESTKKRAFIFDPNKHESDVLYLIGEILSRFLDLYRDVMKMR